MNHVAEINRHKANMIRHLQMAKECAGMAIEHCEVIRDGETRQGFVDVTNDIRDTERVITELDGAGII